MTLPYGLTNDYSAPRLDCDLILKGGITSGVVYPLAICKLAETYRLHSIGGASAGAIGAAAAAAAEYARRNGNLGGYKMLAEMPAALGQTMPSGRTRLLSLFQPEPSTQLAFDALVAASGKGGTWRKVERLAACLLRHYWPLPLLGMLVAIGLFLGPPSGVVHWIAAVIAALLVVVLGFGAVVAVAAVRSYRAVAANYGGVCRGHAEKSPPEEPALCDWLADHIDEVAGTGTRPDPLTFADLRRPRDPRLPRAPDDIELAMMTTNLTHGRPYRLPFDEGVHFWFDPAEMRELFPRRIVAYLEREGRALLERGDHEIDRIRRDNGGDQCRYLPLPPGDLLPVVVGVRLSLSFPVLCSAIPLYAVDWTAVRHPHLHGLRNDNREHSWRSPPELPQEGVCVLSRCWFSDGGICSNLPIHFFDALLPTRPTFALDLRPANPHFPFWTPGKKGSELDNVYVPESPNAGYAETWSSVGDADGALGPAQLVGAMVDTMQNWNDNMLAKAPGYRDRVVRISHQDDEGGMNLEMSDKLIDRLSMRGAAAGYKIGTLYDKGPGWRNHLWVRYRSALGMVQSLFKTAHRRYFVDEQGRDELDALLTEQPSYKLSTNETEAARATNEAFRVFPGFESDVDFEHRAPRPVPELRPKPR